ncbi:MAG: hypothetical protein SGPRY_000516 [Prymnesium sp.]
MREAAAMAENQDWREQNQYFAPLDYGVVLDDTYLINWDFSRLASLNTSDGHPVILPEDATDEAGDDDSALGWHHSDLFSALSTWAELPVWASFIPRSLLPRSSDFKGGTTRAMPQGFELGGSSSTQALYQRTLPSNTLHIDGPCAFFPAAPLRVSAAMTGTCKLCQQG